MQEGHRAIADAVTEKTKARGLGHPQQLRRAIHPLAAACKINEWMQSMEEGLRRDGDIRNYGCEQGSTHIWHLGRNSRLCR